MKGTVLYNLLIAALIFSVLLMLYGISTYIFDIYFFRESLPYGTILFQVVVFLIVLYKIATNIKLKKPIGNLIGVAAVVATLFIGATYLYIAIMAAFGK